MTSTILRRQLCILLISLLYIASYHSFKITHPRYFQSKFLQKNIATTIISSSTSSTSSTSQVSESSTTFAPDGTSYCQCGFCKTAYIIPKALTEREKGSRVKCSVCQKEWYQSLDRLPSTSRTTFLTELSEDKIRDVKRIISETNSPKYPRLDRFEIFVGSIPYTYTDVNLAELFAEYGVVASYVVKDQHQNSRGFGFIEVTSLEDAKRAIQEMSDFAVENRRLTVKLAEDGRRNKSAPNQQQQSPNPSS